MRNNLRTKTTEGKQMEPLKKNIIIKTKKWLSGTTIGNVRFYIKYGNRNLILASMNVTALKKHETMERQPNIWRGAKLIYHV